MDDSSAICSEDRVNIAVAACFCDFPLVRVCEGHILKHSQDTEAFRHFLLPLSAARILSSQEVKDQWAPKLFSLHQARCILMRNLAEIDRSREMLEATRLAAEYQVSEMKDRLERLKQDFQARMDAAVKEISHNALEQDWQPQPESLSHCMWNYLPGRMPKLISLEADRSPSPLRISLKVLSELSSYSVESDRDEAMLRENAELKDKILELQEKLALQETETRGLKEQAASTQQVLARKEAELKELQDSKAQQTAEIARLKAALEGEAGRQSGKPAEVPNPRPGRGTIPPPQRMMEDARLSEVRIELERMTGEFEAVQLAGNTSVPSQSTPQLVRLSARDLSYFDLRAGSWKAAVALDKPIEFSEQSSYLLVGLSKLFFCGGNHSTGSDRQVKTAFKTAYMIRLSFGTPSVKCSHSEVTPTQPLPATVRTSQTQQTAAQKSVERLYAGDWRVLAGQMNSARYMFTPCLHVAMAYLCAANGALIDVFDPMKSEFLAPLSVRSPQEGRICAACAMVGEELVIVTESTTTTVSLRQTEVRSQKHSPTHVRPVTNAVRYEGWVCWVNSRGMCVRAMGTQIQTT